MAIEEKLEAEIVKCLIDIYRPNDASKKTAEFKHYNGLAIEIMCNAVIERREENK